ncbi:nickel pincer cofactor-dependent isomerase, group 22 [Haladaptatus sp. NG-SE-30]
MRRSDTAGPRPVPEETVIEACGNQPLPELGVVEQVWATDPIPTNAVADHAATAVAEFDLAAIPEGGEVAVGVGSRGIANIPTIVRGVVSELRDRGYEPFVFPAMGSHGGATVGGQREMLESLGVTEAALGCEIRATMETTVVGETPDRGVEVHADAHAAAADAIVPVNRVKPHTDFQGDVESGLSKMIVIGMGKQRGAKTAHEWAIDWSFRNMIPEITSLLVDELPVVGGVAIVEDEHDDTAIIEGVPPEGFLDREAELLETAYDHLPTIPFDDVDVLVVDRTGKDVSGAGMDTNVIGRMVFGPEPAPEKPDVGRIFVRGLTEPSHGNAVGVGSADFIHADLFDAINLSDTLVNALTASTPRGARLPPAVETDRAGLLACLSTIGVTAPEEARVVRIRDTMRLGRFAASPALLAEARDRDDLRVVSEPEPIALSDGQFVEDVFPAGE